MSTTVSRRSFFGAAAVAGMAPSDRVRLGFIASGGRARALMQIFAENPDVDIPVICDPIEPRMQQALKTWPRCRGSKSRSASSITGGCSTAKTSMPW